MKKTNPRMIQEKKNLKTMNNDCFDIIQEPLLEFGHNQLMISPHDGLSMFGPFDLLKATQRKNIIYGVVGPLNGNKLFKRFVEKFQNYIPVDRKSFVNKNIWPPFPGFEAAFSATISNDAARSFSINSDALLKAANISDRYRRVGSVVDEYINAIEKITKRDDPLDVIVCVIPEYVYQNCRPKSTVVLGDQEYKVSKKEIDKRAKGELDMFDPYNPDHYSYAVDFRRQIKARAMKSQIPIQILRETTLSLSKDEEETNNRNLTPLSDRAWNIGVALYYKAGGKPWRLSSAREGVCYIGIAYKLKPKSKQTACCAAQMFLDTGDGVVFMGEYGPWYSLEKKEFHLTKDAAFKLLSGVLKTYNDLEGKELKEIFLHCRSSINREEFEGFQKACPKSAKLVGIRVRKESPAYSIRLFREGTRPVLRGTFWKINDRTGLLWASGYKPRLETYDGWETPLPLRIDIQKGEADIKQVASDIFGLTKLNYNACKLGESEPVTIKFSDSVGEILISNPKVKATSPKFKFYI